MFSMDDRRQLLVDSVKKLLLLKVSESEIVQNLKDVGIGEQQAKELLVEAQKQKSAPEKRVATEQEEEEPAEEELTALEEEAPGPEIPSVLDGEESTETEEEIAPLEEEKEEPIVEKKPEKKESFLDFLETATKKDSKKEKEKPEKKSSFFSEEKKELLDQHEDFDKLWEKGILGNVNESLKEMKKIRSDLDKILDERVKKETEKELKKIKVLQESQQLLMMHNMEASLQKKTDEVNDLIDEKIKYLAKSNKEIQAQIDKLEAKRQMEKSLFDQLSTQLAELKKSKDALVSEFNSELIKAKSSQQSVLGAAEKKIEDIDARANKTLELESTVAEGLIKDAKLKIEQLSIERSKELDSAFKKALNELQTIESRVNPDEIDAKLAEIEQAKKDFDSITTDYKKKSNEVKAELSKAAEQQLNETKKLTEKRFEQIKNNLELQTSKLTEQLNSLESMTEQQLSETSKLSEKQLAETKKLSEEQLAELKKIAERRLDQVNKDTTTQMENITAFKQQFLRVIDSNVDRLNKTIKKVNETLVEFEEQQNARFEAIDAKIAELDEFERNFAKEMGIAIEKVSEQEKKKKE